jgi:hypothetical protein
MLEEAIHALGHWNHQESAFRSISGCDFAGPLHFAAVAYDFMLNATAWSAPMCCTAQYSGLSDAVGLTLWYFFVLGLHRICVDTLRCIIFAASLLCKTKSVSDAQPMRCFVFFFNNSSVRRQKKSIFKLSNF